MNTKQPDSALRRRFAPHSPGPDPISDNLVTEFINETETRGRGLPNSILRINEPHRVAQPGEGRVAEQGQIASGRVIPNTVQSTSPSLVTPAGSSGAEVAEVKRVLKRKAPADDVPGRPGSKRLFKEAQDMEKLHSKGCYAAPKADDLYEWAAVIEGPKNSVYERGTFFLTITIPHDYPFNPPRVSFHTRIYHCNINAQGEVCLDILKDKWNTTMCISTVLDALISLMINCNPDDALVCPIGKQYKEDREQFNKTARLWTERYATS